MVLTGSDFSSNRHLQPLLQGFVCLPENGTSEEKFIHLQSETTSNDGTALPPQTSSGFEQVTDFSSAHRFNNLKFTSDGNPRTLSQIPNHKSSPMLRGYDLATREEIQPVPSQSSHSRSATPASHQTQMCKCYFVASWLTASIALEKVLVPVTKPTGSTVLGVSQVSAQGK